MIKKLVDFPVYIVSIPSVMTDYKKVKYLTQNEIDNYVLDGYIKTEDDLYKQISINRKEWLNKIQYYIKTRYRHNISLTELDNIIPIETGFNI